MTFQLDQNGVTRLPYPDSYFVDRLFDQLNRLTDIKLNGSATSAVRFEYDSLSRRKALIFDNGTRVDYGFQLDDALSTIAHSFIGSSLNFGYGFNNAHQLTSQSVSDAQHMWHSTAGGTTSYGVANNMDQYVTVGGQTLTYNANGCLTFDGTNQYSFDTENHMVTANWILGNQLWRYRYDPMHRQAQKEVGATKTRFIYSGWQLLAEYDGNSGLLLRRYVFGTGLDEPLIAGGCQRCPDLHSRRPARLDCRAGQLKRERCKPLQVRTMGREW